MKRAAGVLLHITSLPGTFGIGTFGKEAYDFADFLEMAGLKYWQILPLGPTGQGDSPYQSFSGFALNPYLINLELLEAQGLLSESDYIHLSVEKDKRWVDFSLISTYKMKILYLAYENYLKKDQAALETFIWEHASWIFDYALFMAAQKEFGFKPWEDWEEGLKRRKEEALQFYGEKLAVEIRYHMFMQFIAYEQWQNLKKYVNQKGIQVIGDIPIYTAQDSADTWANTDIFDFDENLRMKRVSGCPPDAFSKTGQLWNNPVYRWGALQQRGYDWWIDRIRVAFTMHDWVRIDHFRGFESYWSVDSHEKTAEHGSWGKGPGMEFFEKLKEKLGELNIIAEDLGILTSEVKQLREATGFPGMKILQFAFDPWDESEYLPHHCTPNSVVYTGTHDNDTICGWLTHCDEQTLTYVKEYLKLNTKEGYHFGVIRGALSTGSSLAIVPMQDFLGLNSTHRMNIPGTVGGTNWRWRMKPGECSDALGEKINKIVKIYSR